MKKITSVILTAVLLATMLTVFAVPAFAEGKEKVKVPSEVHLHYTGEELTAFEETDKYTVIDGKKTGTGNYYAILELKDTDNYEWESTNSSNSSEVRVSFEIHEYRDNGNGYCRDCGEKGNMLNIDYLERKVNDDNSVSTEEKTCESAEVITPGDTEWGVSGESTWYVVNNVNNNVELENRPVVNGDVHIILKNYATMTANKGITVEGDNSISFYAQSDDETKMGKLKIAATEENGSKGVTAIGGRNGGNGSGSSSFGIEVTHGGSGNSGGNINFCGGKIVLESSGAVCIGGGNGGNGGNGAYGDNSEYGEGSAAITPETGAPGGNGSNGGNGGNGANVYFIAGNITLKNTDDCCIGGGRGGKGGDGGGSEAGNGGNGGSGGRGGNSGKVYFYGGNVFLESENTACIGGGIGGGRGQGGQAEDSYWFIVNGSSGNPGKSGELTEGYLNVFGKPVIKAGKSEKDATDIEITAYTDQPYLSVQYYIASTLGSILSNGNLWIIAAVAVVAVAGAAALIIVKKKKKPAQSNS